MDDQRQPDGNPGHAEAAAWRVNGAHNVASVPGVPGPFEAAGSFDASGPFDPSRAAGVEGVAGAGDATGLGDDAGTREVPGGMGSASGGVIGNSGVMSPGVYPGPGFYSGAGTYLGSGTYSGAGAYPASDGAAGFGGVPGAVGVTEVAEEGSGATEPRGAARDDGPQFGSAPARVDQDWSTTEPELGPEAEPLALLKTDTTGGGEARHRQSGASGLDDETPPEGLPVMEPPLWREAVRYAPGGTYASYQSEYAADYQSEYAADPVVGPAPEESTPAGVEPVAPAEPAVTEPPSAEELAPDPELATLPQRVPAEPDVPVSSERPDPADQPAEPGAARERWTAPELAWIADQLRRDDVPGEAPAEPFDVDAVVAAVREVPGVESASVRPGQTGMHTLRLDLADDADPGQVSRTVARLLLERMGLSAAPQHVPQARPSAPAAASGWTPPPVRSAESTSTPSPPPSPGRTLLDQWTSQRAWTALASSQGRTPPQTPPSSERRRVPPSQLPADEPLGRARFTAPEQPEPDLPEAELAERDLPGTEPATSSHSVDAEPWSPVGWPPEEQPEPVSRPLYTSRSSPRVLIDQVRVSTFGLEATVEVELTAGGQQATGVASGPAVDSYLVRLAAVAASKAIDQLLREVAEPEGPSRCFVEHTGVVEFGNTEVAVAVVLLVCGGWVEQLTGSALVDGDPRQAVVRATLGAVNRRLEALLA